MAPPESLSETNGARKNKLNTKQSTEFKPDIPALAIFSTTSECR